MCVAYTLLLYSAADEGLPVVKCLRTKMGALSVQGSFNHDEYGIAVQSWSRPCYEMAGAILVVAKGGVIAPVITKSFAAQFPAEINKKKNKHTQDAVSSLIDRLNKKFVASFNYFEAAVPSDVDVSDIGILGYVEGLSDAVSYFHGIGRNDQDEANVVPHVRVLQMTEVSYLDITLRNKKSESISLLPNNDGPVLCWKPNK
jgi:hypothetical protein